MSVLRPIAVGVLCLIGLSPVSSSLVQAGQFDQYRGINTTAQVGPRPFFLIDDMAAGPLKSTLAGCAARTLRKSAFSIGHRGAALQFPEHTLQSYVAAARQGAGIIECDVTFTKDKQLVCRHSQCDLHTTTNIVATELNQKCTQPFSPAEYDAAGNRTKAAGAACCTSDITLAEFRTLRGKMDAADPNARTPEQYLGGTADWRTDLYAGPTSGTLLTHAESVELFKTLRVKLTPELKAPSVAMPFDSDGDATPDYTQEQYAQQLIDELRAGGVRPQEVFPQSFRIEDVRYWIANEPAYGAQAVYLDDANSIADVPGAAELQGYKAEGINYVAPPMWELLTAEGGNIVPSQYALDAKAAGLKLIAWTLERSGRLADSDHGGWYYQSINGVVNREGDILRTLDVLAKDVGIVGIFSDWPATVTFYANCMGL